MKINIDAGHGSNTPGKRTPDGYAEHWFNVDVAVKLAEAFDRCGIEYTKTGWNDSNAKDDVDVSLTKRQKQIKDSGCDLSISIHYNAYGDGKSYNNAQGLDVFVSDKNDCIGDSINFANKVHAELVKGTKQNDRGVKRKALSMVNCKLMGTKAAILCELGFMTNEFEAKLMQNPDFILECAEEICRGTCNYIGVTYVEPGHSKTEPSDQPIDKAFKVRIICNTLNIRKSSSLLSSKVGVVHGGEVYTIVEVKGTWGKLKSGAGWISIKPSYVTKV